MTAFCSTQKDVPCFGASLRPGLVGSLRTMRAAMAAVSNARCISSFGPQSPRLGPRSGEVSAASGRGATGHGDFGPMRCKHGEFRGGREGKGEMLIWVIFVALPG